MDCERSQSVAMNFKIDCLKKARPKRWREVIDVDMKVRGLFRCHGSNALETWLQKPAYYMRRQQTGLQASDNWS